MLLNDEEIEAMNETANGLSDKIDKVISDFVAKLPDGTDDETMPFIIMAALANVLTKLALIADEGRQFIFDGLNDMIPDDDVLTKVREMENDNVIPITQKARHLH